MAGNDIGDDEGNDVGNDDGQVDVRQWFGVDGGQRRRDDGVLYGLGEYLQLELLARKSHHCLIILTTFVTVSIVHIVGIVRVHI